MALISAIFSQTSFNPVEMMFFARQRQNVKQWTNLDELFVGVDVLAGMQLSATKQIAGRFCERQPPYTPSTAVERIWQIADIQGNNLAVAFRQKPLKRFQLFPIYMEKGIQNSHGATPVIHI